MVRIYPALLHVLQEIPHALLHQYLRLVAQQRPGLVNHRAAAANIQNTEPLASVVGGHGYQLAVGLVESQRLGDVQIQHVVPISQHEGLVPDTVPHPLDALPGHSIQARVYHRDLPRLGGTVVDRHLTASVGEAVCNVRCVQEVVRKVLLDVVLFVTRADDEFVKAVVTVQFYDVPQDRYPNQFAHGLRIELTFLTDASAETAREDNAFHQVAVHIS